MTRGRSAYPGTKKRGSSWWFYLNVDGKKVWRGSFPTQREASDARAEAQVERRQGRFRDASRITVDEYLREHWLPTLAARLKATTIDSYEQKSRAISREIGSKRLQSLRPLDVEKMQRELLADGSSKRTVEYTTVVLSIALRHARDVGGIIQENPCERVRKPRSRSMARRVLAPEEIRRLLDATASTTWEAFYRLALFTGARRGEILALRWSDIDWDRAMLTIRSNIVQIGSTRSETTTKGGRPRVVTLDTGTVQVLRSCRRAQLERILELGKHWQGGDDGFITTRADGSPVMPSSATQHWSRTSKRLGIDGVRLHDSRHTHATLLLAAGEPLHVVADRLGHKDAMVTSTVYAHVLTEQADQAAMTFARAVGID